jgi:exo-beta-1,3-glucanase (GH17 family)
MQTTVMVTATSTQDTTKAGSTTVTVNPPHQSSKPAFSAIPPVAIPGLGQKMTPLDLSIYETGGFGPLAYSLVGQTNSAALNCSVSGSTLSCDYTYASGVNTVTAQVTDANNASAQTNVVITVTVPTVVYKVIWDFSPYENGQDPNQGVVITDDQLVQRIGAIAPYADTLRVYSSTHGLQDIAMIARRFGLKVYIGIWLSKDLNANETELASGIAVAQQVPVDAAIVGSEVLLRSDLTADQLVNYINRFRAGAPGVPVATADTWGTLLNNPTVVNASDFVFTNYFPYWEGKDISIAVATLNGEDIEMQKAFAGKEIDVSETGWPSCGNPVGNAVPSLDNEAFYFLDISSWAQANNRKVFYFESFDEAWKANYEGPQGACWGVFDQYATIKPGMIDVFNGKTIPDNWTCNAPPGGDGTPTLIFTTVPPIGSTGPLLEQEWHVLPSGYYVAIYIHVPGSGWWIKPYADQPETMINCDGTASTDITTGGNDSQADEIAGFLLPNSYSPPIVLGASSLPADLYTNAVATADVHR